MLLTTQPADGPVLESAPGEIVLRFNEPVAPVFVHVIGPDRQTVAVPEAVRAIDTELRLRLPPNPQFGAADWGLAGSWPVQRMSSKRSTSRAFSMR